MRLTFTDEGHTYTAGKKDKVVEVGIGFPEKIGKKKVLHPVWITKIACPEAKFLAYGMRTVVAEDFDGAPNAYGRDRPGSTLQQGLHPKDHLGNATTPCANFPNGKYGWCGVIAATKAYASKNNLLIDDRYCAMGHSGGCLSLSKADAALGAYPVIQASGPTKGYYISPTSKVKHGPVTDPTTYANALTIPMMVQTGTWNNKHARIGDFGWAVRTDFLKGSAFTLGDANHSGHVGEISSALFNALGKPREASFLVFSGSGKGNGLIGMEGGMTGVGVRTEFSKLSNVENRMELLDFLMCGADLKKFEAIRNGQLPGKNETEQKAEVSRGRPQGSRLHIAAAEAGFPLLDN
jgi:hypothetical protein